MEINNMICYKISKKLLNNLKETYGKMVLSPMSSDNLSFYQEKATHIGNNY